MKKNEHAVQPRKVKQLIKGLLLHNKEERIDHQLVFLCEKTRESAGIYIDFTSGLAEADLNPGCTLD